MSALGSWGSAPPGSSASRDGHRLLVPEASYLSHRVLPAPLHHAELHPWLKPAASAAFPLHPAGALVLYDQAQSVLEETGVIKQLGDSERVHLDRECWRVTMELFRPGQSVRGAMEDLVANGGHRPKLTGIEDEREQLLVTQLGHLATWAAFNAAADLCGEAKTSDAARAS